MKLLKVFISSFVPGVVKPLHALWNEVLAFTFCLLGTLLTMGPVWRGYKDLNGAPENLFKFAAAVFLAAVMFGFGIYSYRRARKIARG